MEAKAAQADQNNAKLHDYELLYGELQTSIQEAETKREGSKSRVQELELMVQSAETEIERLRNQNTVLTETNDNLNKEKINYSEHLENEKKLTHKMEVDKQTMEDELSRLQNENSSVNSQLSEIRSALESKLNENEQLKSELEVLEGDSDRLRSSYEIMESEHNRIRLEYENLSQNYQMVVTLNESLENEVQRLNSLNQSLSLDGDHSRGELQRLSEVETSQDSEIARLQMELQNYGALQLQYQELEHKFEEMRKNMSDSTEVRQMQLEEEELDWSREGKIEIEHLQHSSSSVERNLQQEVGQLKQKTIDLEREKIQLSDELQAAKLKNGKMIQKLKAANNKNENLAKELEKLKQGGFSELDQALEEEMKMQVRKAESERDELKIKLDEMDREKDQLHKKVNVLEDAQEKYLEMKELQDASMRQISVSNKNLESQIAALEWELGESKSNKVEMCPKCSEKTEDVTASNADNDAGEELILLRQTVRDQEQQMLELANQKAELETNMANLESKIEEVSMDNDNIQSVLNSVSESKRKCETDIMNYKTSFIELTKEHENLKEELARTIDENSKLQTEEKQLHLYYDSLHSRHLELQDSINAYKLEQAPIEAEKEKYQEMVERLQQQLDVITAEEPDEVLAAIQKECSIPREENSQIKDEVSYNYIYQFKCARENVCQR